MVILIRDVVGSCDTNVQGSVVQDLLRDHLQKGKNVTLDFSGVFNVTSSFTNTAFVDLLDDFSFSEFRRLVVLKSVNRQIASMIKTRVLSRANVTDEAA